jgi:hypothetical protein
LHCRTLLPSALLIFALTPQIFAEPIPVHYVQGTMRGFLTIRSESRAVIGYAEVSQSVSAERVTMRTTLHFRDGSLDDETVIFTQHDVFRLVSDHHIQRGSFFKQSIDALIESSGQVTIRTTAADGKVTQESSHIDLPADISNGFVGTCIESLPHGAGAMLGMILPIGKGRLIKLNIVPDGIGSFTASVGASRTASLYRIKLELGGIVGVIAPMVGKQPSDTILWVLEGDAPVIVREDTQLADGAPIISLELSGTSFPRIAATKAKK